jgi:hypothetical protein
MKETSFRKAVSRGLGVTVFAMLPLVVALPSLAQSAPDNEVSRKLWVGFEPSVAAWNVGNEMRFDVNALPITFETPLMDRVGLRVSPLLGVRFGADLPSEISNVGARFLAPIYLRAWDEKAPYRGLYAGPALGLSTYPIDGSTHFTFASNMGFAFDFADHWILNFMLETGFTTIFDDDSLYQEPHVGVALNVGHWLF